MPENKTQPTNVSVTEFIASITDESQRADAKTLVKLMQNVTGERPKMWGPSIVGFGSHHYKYETGREGDMPVAAFSPRKTGTVIYGMSNPGDLITRLGKHKLKGSCLHVPKLAAVDLKVLEALIAQSAARHSES